jgi:hypothetical protein
MVADLKNQHKQDKVSKDERWHNHYGEKDPLPALAGE